MGIVKLSGVPLLSQPTTGVCWYMCAQMLYQWSKNAKRGTMKDPATADSGYTLRFNNNGDVASGQNWHLAAAFGMVKHSSISMDLKTVESFLQKHGPIWTGLKKNWGGHNHGHVVVICGVADTGVFIHDPEPMKVGSSSWLTWAQINKALDALRSETVPNPQFLSAV